MRYIMPARLALGVPTVMNNWSLISPIPLETQLLGTSRPDMLESTAEIIKFGKETRSGGEWPTKVWTRAEALMETSSLFWKMDRLPYQFSTRRHRNGAH